MPGKPKRIPQTKEEILAGMRRTKEIARKKDIIVNRFYPALKKATISVDESKALINAMSQLLMGEVMKTMKERKFVDVAPELFKILCTDGERKEEIQALLDTLTDETLFTARELIEGMTGAIETMIREEMQARTLDTMKPDWDKYLN